MIKKSKGLPATWEEKIYKMMAKGYSDVEIRAALCTVKDKFSPDMWQVLNSNNDQFVDILNKGRDLQQAWWERKARNSLDAKAFQGTLWAMNMKNRFGWTDKPDVSIDFGQERLNRIADAIVKLDTDPDSVLLR